MHYVDSACAITTATHLFDALHVPYLRRECWKVVHLAFPSCSAHGETALSQSELGLGTISQVFVKPPKEAFLFRESGTVN